MSRLTVALLVAMLAAPVLADEACPKESTWTFDPGESDTVMFRFVGRSLSSAGTPAAALRHRSKVDATPSAMFTAASVSGELYSLKIVPDTGCVVAGCRAGNVYQITVKPTDSVNNVPMGHACLVVRKLVYTEQP
jgi:hypothetical protein